MSTVIVNLSNLCLILINSCITNGFVDTMNHACAEKKTCVRIRYSLFQKQDENLLASTMTKKTGTKSIKSC